MRVHFSPSKFIAPWTWSSKMFLAMLYSNWGRHSRHARWTFESIEPIAPPHKNARGHVFFRDNHERWWGPIPGAARSTRIGNLIQVLRLSSSRGPRLGEGQRRPTWYDAGPISRNAFYRRTCSEIVRLDSQWSSCLNFFPSGYICYRVVLLETKNISIWTAFIYLSEKGSLEKWINHLPAWVYKTHVVCFQS